MNILIIHAHWHNRGDEAAIRAMIDALTEKYPDAKIKVLMNNAEIMQFNYSGNVTAESVAYPRKRNLLIEGIPCILSKGKFIISERGKRFRKFVTDADIVLHAPGGPSIGDIYSGIELLYLYRLMLVKVLGKPYGFYAPSMGPFNKKSGLRNLIRKKVIDGASIFCLREPISAKYVTTLNCNNKPTVTLDSAFQYPVNEKENAQKLKEYPELDEFLKKNDKVVGITITDLTWNPKYEKEKNFADIIRNSFTKMITYLKEKGYAVLFIPQLFGVANDKEYMESFCQENCFVMDDTHDCYFQQYIISKMYALIGMRYHSNIFSAKMGSPFLSIAYEQKMSGFMEKIGLTQYCINACELSFNELKSRFEILEDNHDKYKEYLESIKGNLAKESGKTTEIVIDFLEKNGIQ